MTIPAQSLLMRVYVGEKHFAKGMPVYEEILWAAKKASLAGATMIKGDIGFGHVGMLQTRDNPRNNDLPIVIEIVDAAEKIRSFLPIVAHLLGNHGLIITHDVTVEHQAVLHHTEPPITHG